MSTNGTATRTFDLQSVSDEEWLIHDHRFPSDDARSVAACLHLTENDEIEVVWLTGCPLPTSFRTPQDALDELVRWDAGTHGSERPRHIAHHPPTTGSIRVIPPADRL